MLFRAIFYCVDRSISISWVDTSKIGNWFKFNQRSYRLDREAVAQVMEKGGRIKGTVEALYVEGYPLPLRSQLNVKSVTKEHELELQSKVGNKPKQSLWAKITGRGD